MLSFLHALQFKNMHQLHPCLGLLSTLVVLVLWEFFLPFPEASLRSKAMHEICLYLPDTCFFVVECLNILIRIQYWETLSLCLALEKKAIYQNFHFSFKKTRCFPLGDGVLEENIEVEFHPHFFSV